MGWLVRRWWIPAGVAVAVGVALIFGLGPIAAAVLGAYAGLNGAGVAIYCDQLRDRRQRLQRFVQALSVAMVPAGAVLMFVSSSGLTPSEISTHGSPDDRIRNASAGTIGGVNAPGGRGGSP